MRRVPGEVRQQRLRPAVQPMRVAIDTNVWISSLLIPDSASAQAIDEALSQTEVVVSGATVEELSDVLSREKFDQYVSLHDREHFSDTCFR